MSNVLIIGGGISGLMTARELVQAGLSVTVLERGDLGRESSWAGGGIVSPLCPWRYPDAVNRLAVWSQDHYPALVEEVREASGLDPEFEGSGLLLLAPAEPWQQIADWARRFERQAEWVAPERVAELEPGLAPARAQAAVWMPQVGQVRNPRLLKSLAEALRRQGVTFKTQTEVTGLALEGDRVVGVDTDSGRVGADSVVVAGGAWSSALLTGLHSGGGTGLEVMPVRGQMLLFKARPGVVNRIVLADGYYAIPRRDGHVLVGSTVEHVGFDKSTTETALAELTAIAHDLIPALADYPLVKQWAGLRPGTHDGVPFIGPYPGVEGLFVNCGHYRNGVVLAPASARLLADLMLNREPAVSPDAYRP